MLTIKYIKYNKLFGYNHLHLKYFMEKSFIFTVVLCLFGVVGILHLTILWLLFPHLSLSVWQTSDLTLALAEAITTAIRLAIFFAKA